METLERATVWRNLLTGGNEYFELRRRENSHILRGKVVLILEPAQPLFVSYEVICDEKWHIGTTWMVNGKHLPELQGCIDIDLSITPSNNTLALQRLKLERGQSQPVTAAWVRLPGLEISPLQQTYKRLDQTRYLYESATGFTAEIRVDASMVVFDYPGGWTRVAHNSSQ